MGDALGHDYSVGANRYRALVALVVVVLGLSVATLVVRVSTELDDAKSIEQPATATETEANR